MGCRTYSCSKPAAILFVAGAFALSPQLLVSQQERQETPAEEIPYILHVTTREVVLNVIAVDGHDHSVSDLAADEMHVTEKAGKSAEIPESISSFRLVDPNATSSGSLPHDGLRIAPNESCLQRQSIHYEIVYHPTQQTLTEGFHEVHIQTSRRGVRLFYRHRYYIGSTAPNKAAVSRTKAQVEQELRLDACSHPLVPPSIALRAARISTGLTETVRYKLNINNDSLSFVSLSNEGHRLQLDFGACNFNADGQPMNFMEASADQVLTPVEYARAQTFGLERILEFPAPKGMAMTRFVVRDRATGNIGVADVVFLLPEKPPVLDAEVQAALATQQDADFEHTTPHFNYFGYIGTYSDSDPKAKPLAGPVGSYGSVVPRPNAFCGDVFELQPGIRALPDFRDLDPIGSVYTSSLAVPYQDLPPNTGIPGVTDRIAWFGVDYRATFWISIPGRYEFELMSDDGSMLQIDDRRILAIDGLHTPRKGFGRIMLDAGRHTIHVPYFEGTPTGVALSLWVRPPGGEWKIFDLRDFEKPLRKTAFSQRHSGGHS